MEAYEVIAEEVAKRGISYAELSRRSGINAELLRCSLTGERKLLADELVPLCIELHKSIGDFEQVKANN